LPTLETDDVRMLVDLGFIALWRGAERQATAIFEGVVAARPKEEAGYLGSALVQLYRGDLDAAIVTLRRLPPSDAAQTFLGLALSRQGAASEARRILNEVVETAQGTSFARLAEAVIKDTTN
jgi:Flp pilus assembly protein TadD